MVIAIGGVDVYLRAREDGRLRAWVELDDEAAPILHPETGLLPLVLGVAESVVFETDVRGLGAESDVFAG